MSNVLDSVGNSLSDLSEKGLTAIMLFLVLSTAVQLIYIFLSRMLHMDELWSQFIRFGLQFAIFIGCLIIILGKSTVTTLLGGIAIGFGYSLQPVICGALQMIYLRSERNLKNEYIQIGNKSGLVVSAGLFHLKLRQGKEVYYISNSKLTETVVFNPNTNSNPKNPKI